MKSSKSTPGRQPQSQQKQCMQQGAVLPLALPPCPKPWQQHHQIPTAYDSHRGRFA